MSTVPPIETITNKNFITEKRSDDCDGKIALKISVNKPEVEERILTTGALVWLSAC